MGAFKDIQVERLPSTELRTGFSSLPPLNKLIITKNVKAPQLNEGL